MSSPVEYQIHEDKTNRQPYWWRIVDTRNHKVLAHSENYYNFSDALAAVRLVINNSASALIINHTSVKAA